MTFEEYLKNNVDIIREKVLSVGDIKQRLQAIHKKIININNIIDLWSNSLINEGLSYDITVFNYKTVLNDIINTVEDILNQYTATKESAISREAKKHIYNQILMDIELIDSKRLTFDKIKNEIFDSKERIVLNNYIDQVWTRVRNAYDLANNNRTTTSTLEEIKHRIIGSISVL